ncbi:MAG: MmcQ/YjbR family DNA-binding protein [bacterium]|nr:MmcQ/YjbR family DNA-binding protein [bacterium]
MHESLIDHCRAKPGAEPTFPFGPDVLVFKVLDKVFALTRRVEPCPTFNLKCDPVRAEMLRAAHPAVTPGYHMNKRHWNTIALDGSLPEAFVRELIDHSYDLVVASLTRAERESLTVTTRHDHPDR